MSATDGLDEWSRLISKTGRQVPQTALGLLDHSHQKSPMRSIMRLPAVDTRDWTLYRLTRESGLAWGTARDVLEGTGTIASLDRVRLALGLA